MQAQLVKFEIHAVERHRRQRHRRPRQRVVLAVAVKSDRFAIACPSDKPVSLQILRRIEDRFDDAFADARELGKGCRTQLL